MTTHEQQEHEVHEVRLYKEREPIFPKAVSGAFRRFKWAFLIVALAVYYLTPWIRWDRGPHAPDQAVLVDLAHRRFYFFFIEIWPQEFYYVAGLLIMAGIGLFLLTSSVGRAWCGYACPQTIWTDLFMKVERMIDGDRNAQIRLYKSGWTAEKLRKRALKHAVWLLIAIATGGAWVFYFDDAPTLFMELVTGQAPYVAYATIAVLTFFTYSLAGLMREQVCIYMCPWPRIQGAMLDENSLLVTYNDWRGEPRTRGRKRALAAGKPAGDCIDCNACVAVCPVGIDIRDGQQLECITCALCIDACDEMMKKTNQPKGLIAYTTIRDYDLAKAGRPEERVSPLKRILRLRTVLYFFVWAAVGVAMLVTLMARDRTDLNVQPDRNPLFIQLSSGDLRNAFTVKTLNMLAEPREYRLTAEGLDNATLTAPGVQDTPANAIAFTANPDAVRQLRVLVRAPNTGEKRRDFDFVLQEVGGEGESDSVSAVFNGPGR